MQIWPANKAFPFLLLHNVMNATSEQMMITLCLVPHIVPSTYPEVCNVTTEYLLPGLCWARLGWDVLGWAGLGCGANYTIFQI